jgi:hypothetical protein
MREGELMESDAFRTFFDLARLDNEAILRQTEHLGDTIRAHRKILASSYFSAIEAAIDELEAEATAYEVLENQKYSGFSKVIRNWDFSMMGGVPGGDPESPSFIALKEDSRGGETLAYATPVSGDGGLHLAVGRDSSVIRRFDSVGLQTDSSTPQTKFEVNTSSNSPNNAINGNIDVGWNHSILLNDYVDVCRLKTEFVFSGAKRINAVCVQGIPRVPMVLYSGSYTDSGGQSHTLNIGTSASVSRDGLLGNYNPITYWRINHARRTFPVGNITARKVVLTFQQDTAVPGDFFYSEEIGDWERKIDLDVASRFLDGTPDLPGELEYGSDRPASPGRTPLQDAVEWRRVVGDVVQEEVDSEYGEFGPEPGDAGNQDADFDYDDRRDSKRKRRRRRRKGSRRRWRQERNQSRNWGERADRSSEAQANSGETLFRPQLPPGVPEFFTLEDGSPSGEIADSPRRASFVEYSFGFRDVYALEMEYLPNGLFIPESISQDSPSGTLAFYTDVEYPTGENTSFEILMRKENYDADGLQLDVETLPILSYGSSSVDERLYFTRREDSQVIRDVGRTRFYPDLSQSVIVYRGNETLTIGSDYEISVDDGGTWETSLSVTGTEGVPPKFLIKVAEPRTDQIFRVEYTPKLSTSDTGGELWLTPQRTARLGRNQTYVFDNNRSTGLVDHSLITLQIIARANTLNTRVSPYLKNLVILGG